MTDHPILIPALAHSSWSGATKNHSSSHLEIMSLNRDNATSIRGCKYKSVFAPAVWVAGLVLLSTQTVSFLAYGYIFDETRKHFCSVALDMNVRQILYV